MPFKPPLPNLFSPNSLSPSVHAPRPFSYQPASRQNTSQPASAAASIRPGSVFLSPAPQTQSMYVLKQAGASPSHLATVVLRRAIRSCFTPSSNEPSVQPNNAGAAVNVSPGRSTLTKPVSSSAAFASRKNVPSPSAWPLRLPSSMVQLKPPSISMYHVTPVSVSSTATSGKCLPVLQEPIERTRHEVISQL